MNWSPAAHTLHKHIKERELWQPGDRLLLAFSGGRDSVFLAEILLELQSFWKLECCLLRFNHGLRVNEDDSEDQFCEEFAKKHDLDLKIIKLDVLTLNTTNKLGTEANARQLRYEHLEKASEEWGASAILTAHHQDDQAETVLYRLFSGSEIHGLHGILLKNKKIIRPLLQFSREEINHYLQVNDIKYIEDSSNSLPDYRRNRLRNELIPLLRNIGFADPSKNLLKTIESVQNMSDSQQYFIQFFIDNIMPEIKGEISLSKNTLSSMNPIQLDALLYYFLKGNLHIPKHVPQKIRRQLLQFILNDRTGAHFQISENYECSIDRDTIIFAAPLQTWIPVELDLSKEVFISEIGSIDLKTGPSLDNYAGITNDTAYFPTKLLETPLILRPWQDGDIIKSFGYEKNQKVSDILTKAKIPVRHRKIYPVLSANEEILWIPGVKRTAKYKLSAGNKEIIIVNFRLNQERTHG